MACLLIGCAGPVAINDRFAAAQGLSRSLVRGTEFTHVVYTAPGGTGPIWHIYLEGDGRPWQSRTSVAHDPTAAETLMLRLMGRDAAPSIYLGRPCYLGQAREPGCAPWVWTHGRYSELVIASLQAALERLIAKYGITQLVLIGHSGGGTLAMLLAERFPQTGKVITLAGNLDVEAWRRKHGYSALLGSLNPAARPPLPGRIEQWHFRGTEDRNLPPSPAEVILIDGVGHTTGWEGVFCGILQRVGGRCRRLDAGLSGAAGIRSADR